jgi:hypothetical protein
MPAKPGAARGRDDGRPHCDASEAAQFCAELAADRNACPDDVADELRRLLGHDLAVESTARLRFGHLRLLTHLIRTRVVDGHDEFIRSTQYDRECAARREAFGENWPGADDLRRQYGHWLGAYKAASAYWLRGGDGRVPANYRHSHFRQGYQPERIVAALIRARKALGRWPTEWEYELWARLVRRTAATDPHLPNPKALRKAFDGFELALLAAMDVYDEQRNRDD